LADTGPSTIMHSNPLEAFPTTLYEVPALDLILIAELKTATFYLAKGSVTTVGSTSPIVAVTTS